MAANGITLAPMRMADVASTPKPTSKYMPPSKRVGPDGKAPPVIEKVDMTEKSFPSLGSVQVKAPAWGKHVVSKPEVKPEVTDSDLSKPKEVVEKKETLSDKIKEKLRLDAIAEELGTKRGELDPWNMTDAQLGKAGWVRLRLSSAKDICMNGFSNQDNPYLRSFITEADSGMTFDEYVHYKKAPENTLAPSRKKTTTPEIQHGEYTDED